jgi:hypothetical protein
MGIKDLIAKITGKAIAKKLDLKETKDMENKKQWWKSKTVWQGVAIAIINAYAIAEPITAQFGYTLPPIPSSSITFLNVLLGGGIVYTRSTATKQIQ